jgi:hypothetical protein
MVEHFLRRLLTRKTVELFEKRYEKRLVKSDKEVVFKGTFGSVFMIFIYVFVISITVSVWFVTDKSNTLFSAVVVFVMSILLWIVARYLKAKIILRPDSIILIGPVYDFEEDALADFMSQLFASSRTIELRWDDIDRILDGLVIYTKSGQRYIMNTAYFSMKLIPMIGKYLAVEKHK